MGADPVDPPDQSSLTFAAINTGVLEETSRSSSRPRVRLRGFLACHWPIESAPVDYPG
jgi:hypothetical protein